MFDTVLVANRGEIAVRVIRTCRDLGVRPVALYSDADREALHVRLADGAVHLPGVAPAETYLNLPAVIEAARRGGGRGRPPRLRVPVRTGRRRRGRRRGRAVVGGPATGGHSGGGRQDPGPAAGRGGGRRRSVPGMLEPVSAPGDVLAFAETPRLPRGDQGGRRGRWARAEGGPPPRGGRRRLESAIREAAAYFGCDDVYLERYLPRPKHIEVQILAPAPGPADRLGVRDCSLQRRHQKLVEETPPPLFAASGRAMGEAAVEVADACGYVNAGTVEFLVDDDGPASTSWRSMPGCRWSTRSPRRSSASTWSPPAPDRGRRARSAWPTEAPRAPRGHAIECRINAEDPSREFRPGPAGSRARVEPGGPRGRVDSGFGEGDEVPAGVRQPAREAGRRWAPSREQARRRALRALDDFGSRGCRPRSPPTGSCSSTPNSWPGTYSTRTVESGALDALVAPPAEARPAPPPRATVSVGGQAASLWNPAIAASIASGRGATAADGSVVAPMHGTVLKVLVAAGDEVGAGAPVAVLEAMKMETVLAAPFAGRVAEVAAEPGEVVEASDVVVRIEPSSATPDGGPTPSG